MADWTYGVPGTTFPVEPGQEWRQGRHTWICADIMADDARVRGHLDEVTLVYTDPPWGQGLANGFRTKAGLGRATYDWREIYRRAAGYAHERGVPIWAEGSVIDSDYGMPVHGLLAHPGNVRGYWQVTYMGGHPSGLYYSGPEQVHADLATSLDGLKDFEMVRAVLDNYWPGVVLDPCSGLGGVPLVAEQAGWGSVNAELSQWRMSKAMYRMRELTGTEPERTA